MFNQGGLSHKGVATLLVLLVILLVILLANIVLMVVSSQFRLTHHQVNRVRAYYAAQAGINYALEMIRISAWAPNPNQTYNYSLCASGCTVNDPDIPHRVDMRIEPVSNGIREVSATTNYTYTPP